ncbi:hypothetical protein PHIN3_110 [Sinorhizobium phage phiN3]|uniref:Uncharacterized protein n=1 Tax=Sinorhizobium phage phiN3 TaxID=1647405 RepID=A0A0F6YPB8_9CAUD|nr:hypothetical protein AVT40_gp110 [Sinorhizobium phage phiN3]AKF13375.1 hypothetical protein PHIN3_110 [Sinorhizobium phage phiN3]
MFKKILLSVAILASTVSFAEAKCEAIPQSDYASIIIEQPSRKIAIFGDLPGPFKVLVQDRKTCETSRVMKMTEDQLFTRFGIADELEGECVDNPECG